MRAGHQVKVLNLSSFPWGKVEEVIRALDADVYGLSCWTANRHGVALRRDRLSSCAMQRRTVVVGGPHATPLAREMLPTTPRSTRFVGESDTTFLELLAAVERGEPSRASRGRWPRRKGLVEAPERPSASRTSTPAPRPRTSTRTSS
jgi:anaerobic magnesium-protoporphyrin IX monomethyl ester cyclase